MIAKSTQCLSAHGSHSASWCWQQDHLSTETLPKSWETHWASLASGRQQLLVELLFDFAVVCLSGVCQCEHFAARPEVISCKMGIPVLLYPGVGSHSRDPRPGLWRKCFGSSESDGWREEKIFFSPAAKSCFQEWELDSVQGRRSEQRSAGVGLPYRSVIPDCPRTEPASSSLSDPSF